MSELFVAVLELRGGDLRARSLHAVVERVEGIVKSYCGGVGENWVCFRLRQLLKVARELSHSASVFVLLFGLNYCLLCQLAFHWWPCQEKMKFDAGNVIKCSLLRSRIIAAFSFRRRVISLMCVC
jgi:hypothetical protein